MMVKNGDFSGSLRQMAVCQNLVPQVNIKIAGKWMFIPLKLIVIGFDPTPNNQRVTKPKWMVEWIVF
jgi:hypothetical protein